jgi:DNA-binding XRE family transcriptional regulator
MAKKKEIIYGFIYFFDINEKKYVGQAVNLKRRFKTHFKEKRRNLYFHNSLRKYFFNSENCFKILETWKKNERPLGEFKKLLNSREIFWIKKLNTYDPKQKKGWNLTKGGSEILGSTSLKGKVPWNKGKIGLQKAWNKGIILSEKQKENMSGEKNHNFGKPAWNRGIPQSKEAKIKNSKAHQGEKHPRVKLTESKIQEIKKSSLTQKKLAEIYKVDRTTIGYVKNGKSWKHLNINRLEG